MGLANGPFLAAGENAKSGREREFVLLNKRKNSDTRQNKSSCMFHGCTLAISKITALRPGPQTH